MLEDLFSINSIELNCYKQSVNYINGTIYEYVSFLEDIPKYTNIAKNIINDGKYEIIKTDKPVIFLYKLKRYSTIKYLKMNMIKHLKFETKLEKLVFECITDPNFIL